MGIVSDESIFDVLRVFLKLLEDDVCHEATCLQEFNFEKKSPHVFKGWQHRKWFLWSNGSLVYYKGGQLQNMIFLPGFHLEKISNHKGKIEFNLVSLAPSDGRTYELRAPDGEGTTDSSDNDCWKHVHDWFGKYCRGIVDHHDTKTTGDVPPAVSRRRLCRLTAAQER